MSKTNFQFSVAAHIMAVLGASSGEDVRSAELACSVNADPSYVRRVLSKLAKAGLVITTRGQNGACSLARPAAKISLLDIYRASGAPPPFAVHDYPVARRCAVSRNMKDCMQDVLQQAQQGFEQGLAKRSVADMVKRIGRSR